MTEETVAKTIARRRDPLRSFMFRLKLIPDGLPEGEASAVLQPLPRPDYIAGVRSVTGLSWTLGVQDIWSGGNNYHRYAIPDRINWEILTLEQGVALDNRLEEWADAARALFGEGKSSPIKRTLMIDLWNGTGFVPQPPDKNNQEGNIVRSFTVHNAWVRKFVALPKLDAMSSEVAFHTLEIAHEGWSVR